MANSRSFKEYVASRFENEIFNSISSYLIGNKDNLSLRLYNVEDMDKWDKCGFPVDERDLEGRVCYGGLDLSSTTDITAFVLVFSPEDDAGKYKVLPYFWVPEDP